MEGEAYYVQATGAKSEIPAKFRGRRGVCPATRRTAAVHPTAAELSRIFGGRGNDAERSDDCRVQSQLARRADRARRSDLRRGSQGIQRDDSPGPPTNCAL